MVMERPLEINPPSGSVTRQELLLILISESRHWRNGAEYRVTGSSSRVSRTGGKYRPKVGLGAGPTWPGGQGVRPAPDRARRPLGQGVAPSGSPSDFWTIP